ncbi:MAG: sugar phosphate isomerase/epimerase [Rubrobacter sp.]|nr:sugar phosphate isomerase/epimerase [Rubrobacter sp.]
MKVGLFTVGIPDLTPEEGVEALAAAGYEGIEWRVTHVPEDVRDEEPSFWGNNLCTLEPKLEEAGRARRISAEAGLEIVGLGTYLSVGDLDATEDAMRFAWKAGSPRIRVGVGRPDGETSYADLFGATQKYLAGVEELSREYGVKALVEIHHGTICPSASLTHRLVSDFDPECIGVIFDPGNMVHEGFENYRIGLELLGPHLAHVHLKNAAYERPEGGGVWKARWSPFEDGIVDFAGFIEDLENVGYDGWLVVEDFSATRPSREMMAHDLGFIRRLLAG